MNAIDSSILWPSLTAALPIPLPSQTHHLFALFLLLGCQELLRKWNNHAGWLCYKFMIPDVSWTLRAAEQPCYSLLLGWSSNSTQQLFPPHPPQLLHFYPHSPQSQHMISPPTAENIEAIRDESPPLPSSTSPNLSVSSHRNFILHLRRILILLSIDFLIPLLTSANILFHQCAFSFLCSL